MSPEQNNAELNVEAKRVVSYVINGGDLKIARIASGRTQKDLGELLGHSQQYQNQLENAIGKTIELDKTRLLLLLDHIDAGLVFVRK